MRHRHRWPYIFVLPLWLYLPTLLLATASPMPLAKTRHQEQRQLHRLVGGHIRILQSDLEDAELITASAGENSKKQKGKSGDEEKKTLSQQVADGKYGLIQKELFKKPPKKPGIISYAPNPEVPKDNIATLGGLTKNEIWLAENHLLVIKGGSYPPHDDTKQDYVGQIWQPIDDYNAPLHQVKIPKNPKVPPPFPVQLTDEGPLQILGTNSSRTLNASAETPAYALPPPPGWDGEIPPQSEYFPESGPPHSNSPNPPTGQVTMRVPVSGEPPGGMPFPPAFLNGSLPPFFAHLPPGAAILPAPGNETNPDLLDEDDPSIYYPPPYSFYYPKDNSSHVPPGPLVPGIILPPPPKFFGPLEEDRVTMTTTTTTTRKPPQTRPSYTTKHVTYHTTTTEPPLSNEISTSKPFKTIPTRVSVVKNYSKVTVRVGTSRRPQYNYNRQPVQTTKLTKTTIPTTGKPKLITILPVHVDRLNRTYLPATSPKRKPSVTILRPVKHETATPKLYSHQNEVTDKPSYEQNSHGQKQEPVFNGDRPSYNTQRPIYDRPTQTYNSNRQKTKFDEGVVSTTQVPLKYYTTAGDVGVNYVTTQPEKFSIGIRAQYPKPTPKPPANFYFYEETDPGLNTITTEPPAIKQNTNYYSGPNQYYVPVNVKPTIPPPPVYRNPSVKPQFIYVTGRPYESEKPKFRYVPQSELRPKPQNTFSIHIAKLQNQIHQYPSTPQSIYRPTSKPVYQYSFEAENYRRPGGKTFRPSPSMDDSEDGFRPIPKYSVQIQPAIEIIPSQRPNYQQIEPLNVEEPSYYSTAKPENGYHHNEQYLKEVPEQQRYVPEGHRNPGQILQVHNNPGIEVTPSRPIAEFSFEVTPNPIHQGFYTKPDEGYFDENTKQYFTIFGRKLPSSTTPLPVVGRPTPTPHQDNFRQQPVRSRYKQARPISLESDINVNYIKPRPTINQQSESIHNNGQYYVEDQSQNPEIIKAIEITPPPIANKGNKERYIHYQLPGDEGAHFYFLTPQAAERRRQATGYFYEKEDRTKRGDAKPEQKKDKT